MNNLTMKKAVVALPFLFVLGQVGPAAAYDSGPTGLGSAVGATDYYKVTCSSGDTDHLEFKLTDNTPLPVDAQVLNLQVSKKGLVEEAPTITPGLSKEVSVHGGNGKYKIRVNTAGTAFAGKQTYTLGFQCLNVTDQPTRSSPKGASAKLKKGKTKTHLVNCSKKGSAGNTEKLLVTLTNTTKSGAILAAQVFKGRVALNTTDGNELNVKGGSGDYYVTVDHTGTDPSKDNSKDYAFQSRCVNGSNDVTAEPTVLQLQDQ